MPSAAIVTTCSPNYEPVLALLLTSLERVKYSGHVHVHRTLPLAPPFGAWTDSYYSAIRSSMEYLLDRLESAAIGSFVIKTDADIQFFQPFEASTVAWMERMDAEALDMLAMCEGARQDEANGGFYMIRVSQRSLAFFRQLILRCSPGGVTGSAVQPKMFDQQHLNEMLGTVHGVAPWDPHFAFGFLPSTSIIWGDDIGHGRDLRCASFHRAWLLGCYPFGHLLVVISHARCPCLLCCRALVLSCPRAPCTPCARIPLSFSPSGAPLFVTRLLLARLLLHRCADAIALHGVPEKLCQMGHVAAAVDLRGPQSRLSAELQQSGTVLRGGRVALLPYRECHVSAILSWLLQPGMQAQLGQEEVSAYASHCAPLPYDSLSAPLPLSRGNAPRRSPLGTLTEPRTACVLQLATLEEETSDQAALATDPTRIAMVMAHAALPCGPLPGGGRSTSGAESSSGDVLNRCGGHSGITEANSTEAGHPDSETGEVVFGDISGTISLCDPTEDYAVMDDGVRVAASSVSFAPLAQASSSAASTTTTSTSTSTSTAHEENARAEWRPLAIEIDMMVGSESARGQGLGTEALTLFLGFVTSRLPELRLVGERRMPTRPPISSRSKTGSTRHFLLPCLMAAHACC